MFRELRLGVLIFSIAFVLFPVNSIICQQIAILKYSGGGDWYANPTALPNLIEFSNDNIYTSIKKTPETVEAGSPDIFNYPIIFMTGHGNVLFTEDAIENLRTYLTSGGFLHISDNYGLNQYIRKEIKKIFPSLEFQEIPYNHPIYHQTFSFENGLPKIHEHDGGAPHAYGIFHEGRMMVYYTFNTNISDGWADPDVHKDPEEVRLKALRMGVNIVVYALLGD